MTIDLRRLQSCPALFQDNLVIPTGSGLKTFGEILAEFQRDCFDALNPSLLAIARHETPPISRFWIERTKGSSKDTDLAVCLLWLLSFSKRSLRIQVGAFDSQQADEIRQIIASILRVDEPLNRLLAQLIDVQQNRVINKRTESICEILTHDRMGSHGSRPDVVLIDELSHQPNREFAETLMDNADKMPNGLAIIVTNAGFIPSWQHNWKQAFAASDRWRILEFNEPAPWIDSAALAESRKRNSPARFDRLWRGIWASGEGDGLDHADISACITHRGPMTGSEQGYEFYGGLDIGLRKDATAFVIIAKHIGHEEIIPATEAPRSSTAKAMIDLGKWDAPPDDTQRIWHEGSGNLRLADVKVWKPKPGVRVSLEMVRAYILRAQQKYNLAGISVDPHQGEHLLELLANEHVPVIRTPQTVPSLHEQALATIEAFQQRTLELYNHPDVIADLRALRLRDNGQRVRLWSPDRVDTDLGGTGHGDTATALSLSIALSKSQLNLVKVPPSRILVY